MFGHSRSVDAPGRTLEWVLLAVFALASAWTLSLHEMWRDETHAWLIAREASTLRELFVNLEYDGHPPLWHLCLYLLSRFRSTPELMQILHGLIASLTAFLLLFRAPFTRRKLAIFSPERCMWGHSGRFDAKIKKIGASRRKMNSGQI